MSIGIFRTVLQVIHDANANTFFSFKAFFLKKKNLSVYTSFVPEIVLYHF